MLNYGEMLLSAVIDRNDVLAIKRFGVGIDDFLTPTEKNVYKFITDYADMNRQQAPDPRTVVNTYPDFVYRTDVTDTYEYMVRQLKSKKIEIICRDFLTKEVPELFSNLDGQEFLETLSERIEQIKTANMYTSKVGVSVKRDVEKYSNEYRKRKQGKSNKRWKSAHKTINDSTGGYTGGNLYAWAGRSGRGKSIFTMIEAVSAAMQGATVLVWALEMNEYEWLSRVYTFISSAAGIFSKEINGVKHEVGFAASDLMNGRLDENDEQMLEEFLSILNESLPGEIILRAVDHIDFYKRGCAQLEADILNTKADVCLVDPIYYMDMEKNASHTKGGDVARTSVKLRHIAGYTGCVIHVVTQAEEVRDDKDSEGQRELRLPTRAEIKKSKAILEDSSNIFLLDSLDGRALIGIGKGRNGGEGVEFEVTYLPNYGIVKEVDPVEIANKYGF
jgi:hypothetical protein